MTERMPYIIGNWKMNLDIGQAMTLASDVADIANDAAEDVGVGIAPPSLWIPLIASEQAETSLLIGSQDVSAQAEGAYTGEISAGMLAPWCTFALVGHSERRQYHGETLETVRAKVDACLANTFAPVLCIGETQEERDAGKTLAVIEEHLLSAVRHLDARALRSILVAYEPVWAIGTGRTASTNDAQEVARHIRSLLRGIHAESAEAVPVLYGGSVKADNASAFFACEDIDGALVGGASLNAASFLEIVRAALPKD